jgi:TrmH family RNA methyltransferase
MTAERFAAARNDPGLVVLEGFHAVKHALRFGAELLELAAPDCGRVLELAAELAPDLADTFAARLDQIRPEVFAGLATPAPPTGVLAIARRPEDTSPAALDGPGPAVLLERPRHHGNLGAAVRVAAAAGAAAVLTTGDADPWHPAALRGSAGLHFALPVARVDDIPRSGRPLVALDPEGVLLEPGAVPSRALLAFGSERRGLDQSLLARADLRLAIPMRPGVSSLNLATAVAVVLYLAAIPGT